MSTEPRWRITVDRDVCIGAGVCMGDLPHRFRFVNGQSQPVDAEIDADDEVLAVADSCPREAIQVVEVSTGRVIAPLD
ncbi:ferredoxin [Streptomyces sp. NPDC018045]|uniref:ferredoxin n=1 Tax=Streptomyces sp. NPDC018045 TaxID=3365037 RepID=UPI0037B5E512